MAISRILASPLEKRILSTFSVFFVELIMILVTSDLKTPVFVNSVIVLFPLGIDFVRDALVRC